MPTDPTGPPKDMTELAGASEFVGELLCGRLRWLFSALAVASAAALIWVFLDRDLDVSFPIHMSGRMFQSVILTSSVMLVAIAYLNWRNWLRWKRTHHV